MSGSQIRTKPIVCLCVCVCVCVCTQGEYSLRVTGRDASGEDLMCLDVDFELVLPTRAQQDTLTQQDKTSTY